MQASLPITSQTIFLLSQTFCRKKGEKFEYVLKTSTTIRRHHAKTAHTELYNALAKEKGWISHSQGIHAGVTPEGEPRHTFSEHLFHERLLRFVVANDQVSFRRDFIFSILIRAFQASSSCGLSRIQRSPPIVETRSHDPSSNQNAGARGLCLGGILPTFKTRTCGRWLLIWRSCSHISSRLRWGKSPLPQTFGRIRIDSRFSQ